MPEPSCDRSATSDSRRDARESAPAASSGASASLRLLLVSSIVAAGCGSPRGLEAPEQIILVSLDTLRADMLNYDGYEEYATSPCLDSFAAANVVFENAIVTEPRTLT